MNVAMLLVCMTVLPVMMGRGVFAVLYRGQARQFYMADALIVGWLVVIGLSQIAHMAAVFLGWSMSRVISLWGVTVPVVAVLCAVIAWFFRGKSSKAASVSSRKSKSKDPGSQVTPLRFGLFLGLLLLIIWQIMTIVSDYAVYRIGDMTVETVETFLQADAAHVINPLTGRSYEVGIPLRIKILCLPTMYAALCSLFSLEGVTLVWKCIPLLVLLLSYCSFLSMGRVLFEGKEDGDKRLMFLTLVALVFCVGDYALGMDGFGLLHCGFMGVTIRNLVLVPYTFVLMVRKKYKILVLVLLAEACISWTLYGMGVCLAVAVGMALLQMIRQRKMRGLSTRKEGA